MSDIPILTSPNTSDANCTAVVDVAKSLISFTKAMSFIGESLNDMTDKFTNTIKKVSEVKQVTDNPKPGTPLSAKVAPTQKSDPNKSDAGIDPAKSSKTPPKPMPPKDDLQSDMDAEKAARASEKEADKEQRKKDFSESATEFKDELKSFGSSISDSILGSTSFITDPFKKVGSLLKKGKNFLTGGKADTVAPKRDVLLKRGLEGSAAVHITDTMKELSEDEDGDERKNPFDSLLGALGLSGLASSLFPTLAKILPWAAIGGSVIWAVIDGIKAIALADGWGVSKVAAFIGGFLGGTESGWKGAFKNAGKWALAGVGVGFLAAGPIGAIAGGLIGAAIGGILGYIGGEKIAKFMDKIWASDSWTTVAAGVVGAGVGFLIGGPVGMIIGGLLGMALGGIAKVLLSEDPKATAKALLMDEKVLALFGALAGGGIGLLFGGPIGMIIGALIGAATGALAAALLQEKERSGKTLKEYLKGLFVDPFIDFFTGIGNWFKTLGAIFKQKNRGFVDIVSDLMSFISGGGSAESQANVDFLAKGVALQTEEKNIQRKIDRNTESLEEVNADIVEAVNARDKPGISKEEKEKYQKEVDDLADQRAIMREDAKSLAMQLEAVQFNIKNLKPVSVAEAIVESIVTGTGDDTPLSEAAYQTQNQDDRSTSQKIKDNFRGIVPEDTGIKVLTVDPSTGTIGATDPFDLSSIRANKRNIQNENDAIITSDGQIISLNPNDNIIATQNDAEVMADIDSINREQRVSETSEMNDLLKQVLQNISKNNQSPTVITSNTTIKRYDPENIMESLAAATP